MISSLVYCTVVFSFQEEPADCYGVTSPPHTVATSPSHPAVTSPFHSAGNSLSQSVASHTVSVSPSAVQSDNDGYHAAVTAAVSHTHSVAVSPIYSISTSPSSESAATSVSGASSPSHTTDQLLKLKCNELQQEIANQKKQHDIDIMLLKKQFSEDLVAMESSKQQEVSMLKFQFNSLQHLLANQRTGLASLVSSQANNTASLMTQRSQVEEECQLVTIVSHSQIQEVARREENITHLLAEVYFSISYSTVALCLYQSIQAVKKVQPL